MEQQTISIAKAGITTILNSRTSILAAANPIFGTYLSYKDRSEQIDLQSTILSRFDCIFTVIDKKDSDLDKKIASHVLGLHMNRDQQNQKPPIDYKLLKKYITYAKTKCHPKLDD